jgi:hypothetical protein
MKTLKYILSLLLLLSVALTGILGYIQSSLELRRFVPHKYFAYTTLVLTAVHAALNFKRIIRFFRGERKKITST